MLSKLKQFKDLRSQAKTLQNTLAKESVTINKGEVIITMDGNITLTGLTIDKNLLHPDKQEKLQILIKEAHAEALKKMQRIMAMKMKDMGGLPKIPGLN